MIAPRALEAVGLDPQVGFLHRDRSGRPSLALDLMEEFRPFFADRLALSLVNLRQVQAKGFKKTESGAVEMTDDTRKDCWWPTRSASRRKWCIRSWGKARRWAFSFICRHCCWPGMCGRSGWLSARNLEVRDAG
jgi:CRISPR-associated endonuclease Cas1